jgi:hypothetical protein
MSGSIVPSSNLGFDEGYYLAANPDVRSMVDLGVSPSGRSHYEGLGRLQGRSPMLGGNVGQTLAAGIQRSNFGLPLGSSTTGGWTLEPAGNWTLGPGGSWSLGGGSGLGGYGSGGAGSDAGAAANANRPTLDANGYYINTGYGGGDGGTGSNATAGGTPSSTDWGGFAGTGLGGTYGVGGTGVGTDIGLAGLAGNVVGGLSGIPLGSAIGGALGRTAAGAPAGATIGRTGGSILGGIAGTLLGGPIGGFLGSQLGGWGGSRVGGSFDPTVIAGGSGTLPQGGYVASNEEENMTAAQIAAREQAKADAAAALAADMRGAYGTRAIDRGLGSVDGYGAATPGAYGNFPTMQSFRDYLDTGVLPWSNDSTINGISYGGGTVGAEARAAAEAAARDAAMNADATRAAENAGYGSAGVNTSAAEAAATNAAAAMDASERADQAGTASGDGLSDAGGYSGGSGTGDAGDNGATGGGDAGAGGYTANGGRIRREMANGGNVQEGKMNSDQFMQALYAMGGLARQQPRKFASGGLNSDHNRIEPWDKVNADADQLGYDPWSRYEAMPAVQRQNMAMGGLGSIEPGNNPHHYNMGTQVHGQGDGRSDNVPAMLSIDEYVIPADVVAALGDGSSNAGAKKLADLVTSTRDAYRKKLGGLPPPKA